MPCEVIPCIVNSTYIANDLDIGTMHDSTKPKVVQENDRVWTKIAIHGGALVDKQVSGYGRRGQSDQMIQNNLKFRDLGHRLLPRAFSALGDFGPIEETEPTSLSNHLCESRNWFPRTRLRDCETLRRYSTSSWPTEKLRVSQQPSREVTAHRNNRRRQSESFIISGTKAFGLVGYRNGNDSIEISSDQRSENPYLNTKQAKRQENDTRSNKTLHNTERTSVEMSSVVAATLEQPKSYYSLPSRRYSLPVKNMTNDFKSNLTTHQRNSLQTEYNFDNDTELQWQRLVARAKTLQFATTKRPEIVRTRLVEKNENEVTQKATESSDTVDGSVDSSDHQNVRNVEDVTSNEKENNNNQPIVRRRRRTEERRYSLRKIATVAESSTESQTKKDSDDDSEQIREIPQPGGQPDTLVREKRCYISTSPSDSINRRHSVAVTKTTEESKERISGYSTHGALEYAKTLMGKIQEEGKTKSKKERLDDMSKVLKLVLEELNRIELPDRDLVSLFISLRAKMVNLRAELKADEGETNSESEEMKTEGTKEKKSQSLPRPARPSQEETTMPNHSRRFSWI